MHNSTTKSERDSKYTVADILSSMANGEPVTPTAFSSPNFIIATSTGLTPTGLTPTLTPTTLASLEQSFKFIDAQNVRTSQPMPVRQSGFVPPVVSELYDDALSTSSSSDVDPEWSPSAPKRARGTNGMKVPITVSRPAPPNRNKGGRKKAGSDPVLPPVEEEKRRVRRNRNKVAAAKCRQRRVDAITQLTGETEELEDVQTKLESEIQSLSQQKEQLEFILQAHRPMCKKHANSVSVIVKSEPKKSHVPVPVAPALSMRPTTLCFKSELPTTTASRATLATGVPIVTPSSGIVTFSLDTIVDSTGLTPLCGPPTTCASLIEKNNELCTPTTLISL